jgi:hypothetical protein
VVVVLSAVAVEQQEHQEQAQAVLAVLAISMLAVLAHQEQEHLSVVAVVAQDLLLLAQTHLPTMAVTAAQVVAVGAVLVLVALLAQAGMELFSYIIKKTIYKWLTHLKEDYQDLKYHNGLKMIQIPQQ